MELKWANCLEQPGLGAIGIGDDIRWRLDGIGAEQLSRATQQSAHFVELLLQRRISHVPTLPRPWQPHNSLAAGQSVAAGTLSRWRSSVGNRRASASGERPGTPLRFRPSTLRSIAPRG